MDTAEQCVERFLRWKGYSNVVFEPDGNIPPDFLINGQVAVEVRRLIQYESTTRKPKSVSENSIPLDKNLRKLLSNLGRPTKQQSWFVYVTFARPLDPWKKLEPKIRSWLEAFRDGPQTAGTDNDFGNGLTMKVFRGLEQQSLFVLAGYSDQDSGGWITDQLEESLKFVIPEKSAKIAQYRSKYKEWWLVLTDQIGTGLDFAERAEFKVRFTLQHDWDKIILVNPVDFAD
ncbi:hypothetical protein HGB07_09680, partial [Candidatus Roizmanbacteria bacterium]|nr:hypothetical protein [Candidatus Roizmanbacteria bacterium]